MNYVVEDQAVQWDGGKSAGVIIDAAGDYPTIKSLDGRVVVKYVGMLEPFAVPDSTTGSDQ